MVIKSQSHAVINSLPHYLYPLGVLTKISQFPQNSNFGLLLPPASEGWGRYCFHRCLSVHIQRRVLYLHPIILQLVTCPFWEYLVPVGEGVSQSQAGRGWRGGRWCMPVPDRRVPLSQEGIPNLRWGYGWGTPVPCGEGQGVPQPGQEKIVC